MNVLRFVVGLVIAGLTGMEAAVAVPVDFTSGTTGTLLPGQSFNETRGATATVLAGGNLELQSMTLMQFNIGNLGGAVGARVYSEAGTLLASADMAVPTGSGQTVTIPILATLVSGDAYRFAFFVSDSNGGSTTLFDADPINQATFPPYTDSSGLFQISAYWDAAGDAFPTIVNGGIPVMSLNVVAVAEPPALALLGLAFTGIGWATRRRLNR